MIVKKLKKVLILFFIPNTIFAKWDLNDAESKINDVVDGLFTLGIAAIGIPIFLVIWHLLVSRNTEEAAKYFKSGVIAAVLLAVGKTLLSSLSDS